MEGRLARFLLEWFFSPPPPPPLLLLLLLLLPFPPPSPLSFPRLHSFIPSSFAILAVFGSPFAKDLPSNRPFGSPQ